MMNVSRIPFDEVESLPLFSFSNADRVNVFEKLSMDGCLLDCRKWASHLPNVGKHTDRAARNKEVMKQNIQKQRQKMAAENKEHQGKARNARLRNMRDPFTINDLKTSAGHGCDVCRLFHSLVLAIFPLHSLGRGGGDPHDLQLEWSGYGFALQARDQKRGLSSSFHFYSPPVNQTVLHGLLPGNLLSGDTASPSSLSRAKRWIQNCEASHQRCGEGRDVPLPKRLLDLGPPHATPIDAGIRLAETAGLTGTYMCLSHCWGTGAKPMQTTLETIQSHRAGISFAALPRTFADAVTMARHLEVQYLWIDSLCIIQNSDADWQAEAGNVAAIYRNSFATIAAISSPGSQGGCFSRSAAPDLCFRIQAEDGLLQTIVAARCYEGDGITDDLDLFRENFPALSRAWIYQERILSRRIIYCTRHELEFDCRQDITCECGNRTRPPHPNRGTESCLSMSQSKQAYAEMEYVGAHEGQRQQKHWQKMVMQYTKLQLTKESDKLPAFSGCATHFDHYSVRDNGRYLAGLWEATLAQGLLWLVNMPFGGPRPPWRAPSWSWASVDTPHGITYIQAFQSVHRQRFQESIVAIECVPEGADRAGRVRPGCYMRVRTSLVPAFVRRVCRFCKASRTKKWAIETDSWMASRHPSVRPCSPDGHDGLRLGDTVSSFQRDYRFREGDLELEPRHDRGLCRHARVYLMYMYDSEVLTHYFLVLRSVALADGSRAYERIGLFQLTFKSMAQSDKWFSEEYTAAATKTALVTVV
ncbi:het domain-containing protein [Ophiostoma piceae UAMH 11346]|uniref:Het domain-containing protein n=1 Tax=Ophiostoma piceae (strain UAMH 11346) TaxID=1262450 RepID=S3BPL0_OPHP1|nr:het domain-containing protein [Ophiostoma piceae UAMH 11346]